MQRVRLQHTSPLKHSPASKSSLAARASPRKNVKCESCKFRTRDVNQLGIHRWKVHSSTKRLNCNHPGCNFKTNYSEALRRHMYIHEENPERQFPFACTIPDCGFRNRRKSQMKRHESRHESCGNGQLECKLCQSKFYPDLPSLLFHMYMSHNQTFVCKICRFGAYSRKTLAAHVREHHNSDLTAVKAANIHLNLKISGSRKLPVVILEKIRLEFK